MRVTTVGSIAYACNVETANYLLFIYVLINCAVRNIRYIAQNIGQYLKCEMENVKNKLIYPQFM